MTIEKYLVLNKYLLSLFGIDNFRDFQEKLKDAPTGIDSDGRTYFINIIRSAFENLKIPEDALLIYDGNIQGYAKKINYKRGSITLKYFQYLAALFTEIVLDNLKNNKKVFLSNLNSFFEFYKKEEDIEIIDEFKDDDLKKIALWMATGSGKTLIMHINYYQFLNYNLFSPDNIILITPNEGLSKQHFEELQKSGIPAGLYAGNLNGKKPDENEVLVIEMTKFVEEKKGKGVTLSVDTFEGKNLIFVDEGHKGKVSEEQKWAKLRNKLAENGFVFEYSATFGQILTESQEDILREYAKSIIFDYSYKYFYLDGYGKDFSVLNVKQEKINEDDFQETMFIANLLSFYEQLLVYEENKHIVKDHNLEKPLWIFVGTTVTGKNEESDIIHSDVIQIVEFMSKVLSDEEWVKKTINKILEGKTELKDENDEDVFKNRFGYLRKRGINFDDLFKRIFSGKGKFLIYEIKNAEGEFGLKVGENYYFGVINIGDASKFKKQLEKKGISVQQDMLSDSLFDKVKMDNSPINILIGSKKFIEGWDTWRVSCMGLLNIGKGQGPQIIQLFGRGVRLRGKGMSLKRSEGKNEVKFLEVLNIYGIKADYLSKFLEAISKEEVEFETIEIPIIPRNEEKWKDLYTLAKNKEKKFDEDEVLKLELDDKIYFTIDLLPKIVVYLGEERTKNISVQQIQAEYRPIKIPENIIDLLNWYRIWEEVNNFKTARSYWNLVFEKQTLKNLLLSDRYKILTLSEVFELKTYNDVLKWEDIAILTIKKYIDSFYKKHAKLFETNNLSYDAVNKQLPLFIFEKSENKYSYTIQVDKKQKELIKEIKKLTKNLNDLIKDDRTTLPRICFDNHLYIPILLQSKRINKISPAGLVKSEEEFILGLREYLKKNRDKLARLEIYLLRNYPKQGVGFFNLSGFYPDFIMWIKKSKKQTVVFIDPKGLEHTKGLDDEKIQLKNEIKQLEQKLGKNNITLESFIISKTPYEKLTEGRVNPPPREEYLSNNVLFLDDSNWAEELFNYLVNK